MNLLALDSATEGCSVALYCDGQMLRRYEVAPRRHTELLLPMVESLLQEAGLALTAIDYIACSRGPGAFTGVRVAVAVAQGLAFALDRPVVAISTLEILAFGAVQRWGGEAVLVALDARMGELYWGGYRVSAAGAVVGVVTEAVAAADRVILPESKGAEWLIVGNGWPVAAAVLMPRLQQAGLAVQPQPLLYPDAADLAQLAAQPARLLTACAADRVEPVYLRNQVVQSAPRIGTE